MHDLHHFLTPISLDEINEDEGYTDSQLGKQINVFESAIPDISNTDIIIIGVDERRGDNLSEHKNNAGTNIIRKQLYRLNSWHTHIKIADFGNIKNGATIQDTYAAIKTVLSDLISNNKTVILIGGSHDCTLGQYYAYQSLKKPIEVACVDSHVDLNNESISRSKNFLMEMLTAEPNYVAHYNHIAFQSYFVHPKMLETLDKLRFDLFRLGQVSSNIDDIEPILRNSNMLSFDIQAIKYSDAPANLNCVNGLSGVEACTITQFAGMSNKLSSIGFYGYKPEFDMHELTAKQISQMIWYFIDGKNKSQNESEFVEKHNFNEFHTIFAEVETMFLQSKKTHRWWMQMPDKKMISCSLNDYVTASKNEIPERWLRIQERN